MQLNSRRFANSLSTDAVCSAGPPGPLDGLIEALPVIAPWVKGDDNKKRPDTDPLGTLCNDGGHLSELLEDLRQLLWTATAPGIPNDGAFSPTLAERRDASARAAETAETAHQLATDIRALTGALVPVMKLAAELVKVQTPGLAE